MTHWFSHNERGTWMSFWNCAHNVGGSLVGPMAAAGAVWFGSWQAGTFFFPAVCATERLSAGVVSTGAEHALTARAAAAVRQTLAACERAEA